MLDDFEMRLADHLADALAGTAGLGAVVRLGVSGPGAGGSVDVALGILRAEPDASVGDDERDRIQRIDGIRLRPTLHLQGAVRVRLAGTPEDGETPATTRARLVRVMDRVLLALHEEDVRRGLAFGGGGDSGFELDGFRLLAIDTLPGEIDPATIDLSYRFAGRFWPLGEEVTGPAIREIPTRIAVLPVELPNGLRVHAGAEAIEVPLRADLRALNGADARIIARLRGAAPPGALVGETDDAPEGFVAFARSTDGAFRIRYRPPDSVAGHTTARIETRLAAPVDLAVELGEVAVEVLP